MTREKHYVSILLFTVLIFVFQPASAETINLNSPTVLGDLSLPSTQLKQIKDAVGEAMKGDIDNEIQCGDVRGDCVVRAARQWTYGSSTFREIVVNIHTVGHASFTVENSAGKGWPTIAANTTADKQAKK